MLVIIKNKISIYIFPLCLVCFGISGCVQDQKRDFFTAMQESYTDLKFDSSSYFIKNFGIAQHPEEVEGHLYWKISCDKSSLFYLSGFVRMVGDSLMLTPADKKEPFIETNSMLFDFSAPIGRYWSLYLNNSGNVLYCDSIIYTGVRYNLNDTVFSYSVYPYYFFKKNESKSYFNYSFRINVSRNKGILDIWAYDYSQTDTLFYVALYPKELIIDKRGGRLML